MSNKSGNKNNAKVSPIVYRNGDKSSNKKRMKSKHLYTSDDNKDDIITILKSICRIKSAEYTGQVKWCGECTICEESYNMIIEIQNSENE